MRASFHKGAKTMDELELNQTENHILALFTLFDASPAAKARFIKYMDRLRRENMPCREKAIAILGRFHDGIFFGNWPE